MNLLNFAFSDDHIGVHFRGHYLDLHNNFDFVQNAKSGDVVQMHWLKTSSDWVPDSMPSRFVIEIRGVTYFDVRGDLSDCVDEFGFFDNDTLGKVNYNGMTRPEDGCDILVLRFVGGGELAMQGKSASASCSNDV